MTDYSGLAKKLNELIRPGSKKCWLPEVCFEPSFNECPHKELLESHFYIYFPAEGDLQAKVKEEIQKYVKEIDAHFVVTTRSYCERNHGCFGHYVDPFKTALDDKHVFLDKFPEDINGVFIHFLMQKDLSSLEIIKQYLRL